MSRIYFARAMEGLGRQEIRQGADFVRRILGNSADLLDPFEAEATPDDYKKVVFDDLSLLRTADVLLVDMSIADRNYIGCSCELVYAFLEGIPSVVHVGETDYAKRKWLQYHATVIVSDFQDAISSALTLANSTR